MLAIGCVELNREQFLQHKSDSFVKNIHYMVLDNTQCVPIGIVETT